MGQLHVWPRGEFTFNADLSCLQLNERLDPIVTACRMVTYHMVKHRSSEIKLSEWYRIAVKKMQMTEPAALALFNAAAVNDPSFSDMSRMVDSDAASAADASVSLCSLALTIALHGASRLNENGIMTPKDIWPVSKHSRRRELHIVAGDRVTGMIQERLEEVLALIVLCSDPMAKALMIEPGIAVSVQANWIVNRETLKACDLLFEGIYATVDDSPNAPLKPSPLSHLMGRDNKLRFDDFVRQMRETMQSEPFFIHGTALTSPVSTPRGRRSSLSSQPVKRISTRSIPPNKMCLLRAWSQIQLLVDAKQYRGVHMRITYGNQPTSIVLAQRMMRSVVVDNCDGTGAILLGPVRGTVLLRRLNNVTVSVLCHRLLIENCSDLTIFTQTTSNPFIMGDCSRITLAPYNLFYDDLQNELQHASMQLLPSEKNMWNRPMRVVKMFVDTTDTLNTTGTNKRRSIAFINKPLDEYCWKFLPPEKFFLYPLPLKVTEGKWKSDFINASPPGYADAFNTLAQNKANQLRQMSLNDIDALQSIFNATLRALMTEGDEQILTKTVTKHHRRTIAG